ncbi:SpoIIAA family protein [Acidimangrovimonas sediminis]|uniref:STAS/SEC14 domain-containing protein n=1 Tax=Acidimangrovimonas sediminis TaxID=2056283 RepID=UPI000C807521|nr:STAS/SEC14 domain-containing protein [Acidimangrovimonas sediminis]
MNVSGNFEILAGFPADVVAIEARGKITRADYEEVLIPAIARVVAAEGRAKLLYVLGEGFEGLTAGAAWDDAKLGILHMGEFAKVAVVTDVEWIRLGVKMFAPMLRPPVHLFHLSEMEAARSWIRNDHPEPPHVAEVAADHKLPTLEDKM